MEKDLEFKIGKVVGDLRKKGKFIVCKGGDRLTFYAAPSDKLEFHKDIAAYNGVEKEDVLGGGRYQSNNSTLQLYGKSFDFGSVPQKVIKKFAALLKNYNGNDKVETYLEPVEDKYAKKWKDMDPKNKYSAKNTAEELFLHYYPLDLISQEYVEYSKLRMRKKIGGLDSSKLNVPSKKETLKLLDLEDIGINASEYFKEGYAKLEQALKYTERNPTLYKSIKEFRENKHIKELAGNLESKTYGSVTEEQCEALNKALAKIGEEYGKLNKGE